MCRKAEKATSTWVNNTATFFIKIKLIKSNFMCNIIFMYIFEELIRSFINIFKILRIDISLSSRKFANSTYGQGLYSGWLLNWWYWVVFFFNELEGKIEKNYYKIYLFPKQKPASQINKQRFYLRDFYGIGHFVGLKLCV